jgi:hypothetical protein
VKPSETDSKSKPTAPTTPCSSTVPKKKKLSLEITEVDEVLERKISP